MIMVILRNSYAHANDTKACTLLSIVIMADYGKISHSKDCGDNNIAQYNHWIFWLKKQTKTKTKNKKEIAS